MMTETSLASSWKPGLIFQNKCRMYFDNVSKSGYHLPKRLALFVSIKSLKQK